MTTPMKHRNPDVIFPNLPALPDLVKSALPPTSPQLEFRKGVFPIIGNIVHNIKVEQIAKSSENEARIAVNNTAKVTAVMEGVKKLMLFGQEYELAAKTIRSQIRMLDINEQKAEAELAGLQLRNMQEQLEAKMMEIEYKARIKEAENELA